MSFGENLQFLRKHRDMTQEELAARMEVSRQSVSKWESDGSFPEMDTLLRLCDLFRCDLDTLLRGDVSRRFGEDAALWDRHMNRFAAAIAGGVALVLGGITLMLFLMGRGVNENRALIVFFALLTAAVAVFIVSGMGHAAFLRQHPGFVPCYTPEEMNRFERRFPFLIAIPVALILLGILAVIALNVLPDMVWLTPQWESLSASLLLLCITIAAATLTWAGIQHSKYGFPAEPQTPAEHRASRIWGFGMVGATAVYVGLGLGLDLWDRGWIVYPVAVLVCVAVTILLSRYDDET